MYIKACIQNMYVIKVMMNDLIIKIYASSCHITFKKYSMHQSTYLLPRHML